MRINVLYIPKAINSWDEGSRRTNNDNDLAFLNTCYAKDIVHTHFKHIISNPHDNPRNGSYYFHFMAVETGSEKIDYWPNATDK